LGRDTREGWKKGEKLKSRLLCALPRAQKLCPSQAGTAQLFLRLDNPQLGISGPRSGSKPLPPGTIPAPSGTGMHTLGPPLRADGLRLSLHLLLPCKAKRPFSAKAQLLLLGIILGCSVLGCGGTKSQRSPPEEP